MINEMRRNADEHDALMAGLIVEFAEQFLVCCAKDFNSFTTVNSKFNRCVYGAVNNLLEAENIADTYAGEKLFNLNGTQERATRHRAIIVSYLKDKFPWVFEDYDDNIAL